MFSDRPGFCLVLEGGSLLTLGGVGRGGDCEFSQAGLVLGITTPGTE